MPAPPNPPTEPYASIGKRKRSEQGWTHRKARDARRSARYFEARDLSTRPRYTLGVVDERQLQIHLEPSVPDKFAVAAFERFRGWLVRNLRAKWPETAVVRMETNKPKGGH